MKKKIIACTLLAACLSLGALSGCFKKTVSIKSIEKTDTIGLVDYYTITYTDGTTSGFTVTNGKDGEDAADVTAQELYEVYVANGGTGGVDEFIEKFSLSGEGAQSASAFKSCLLSCMKVYSVFNEDLTREETAYCGSAVIYKMSDLYTYIVTNYHVVYDVDAIGSDKISSKIYGYLYGSESAPVKSSLGTYSVKDDYAIECSYVGGSVSCDVAVLRASTADILAINPSAKPVTVNYEYAVQDVTYSVGNPDDGGLSVTRGIVSVDSEYISLAIDNKTRSYRSIRSDAALNHGSSGGGLFNENGELIGLNNSGDTVAVSGEEVPIVGMNYAIPATIMTGAADGIIYYNLTERANHTKKLYPGITTQAENSRYVYDSASDKGKIVEDVVVSSVEHRAVNGFALSSNQKIGKNLGLAQGDVLKSIFINGTEHKITRLFNMDDLLLTVRVGDKIKFAYSRGGVQAQTAEYTVTGENLFDPDDLNITE